MKNKIAFFLFLLVATLFEMTVVTMSIVLIVLLLFFLQKKEAYVLTGAILAGLLLDASAVRAIGISSIFLTGFLLVVLLYERKYETDSIPFVFFAAFFGSFAYCVLIGYGAQFIQAFVTGVVAVACYIIASMHTPSKESLIH